MTIIFRINFCLLLSHEVTGFRNRNHVGLPEKCWVYGFPIVCVCRLYSIAERFVIERREKVWYLFQCYFYTALSLVLMDEARAWTIRALIPFRGKRFCLLQKRHTHPYSEYRLMSLLGWRWWGLNRTSSSALNSIIDWDFVPLDIVSLILTERLTTIWSVALHYNYYAAFISVFSVCNDEPYTEVCVMPVCRKISDWPNGCTRTVRAAWWGGGGALFLHTH